MRNPIHVVHAATAFVRIVIDPSRLDEVFHLADGLADPEELRPIVAAVTRHPAGAAALRERPRLRLDLPSLRALPAGSLGRAYADLMTANGLDPKDIPTLAAVDDGTYVRAHLYETHDLWHTVTGFGTDVAGELGLQAFYAAQLPGKLPTALLAGGLFNTLVRAHDDRDRRLREIARGWLLGRRAQPLFGLRWSELVATPLDEVRAALGLDLDGAAALLPPDAAVQPLPAAA